MNIKELRGKYPQYDDLSDEALADAMHQKYYSDLPKEQVYQTLGVGEADRTLAGTAGDVGVTALKSVVGLPQAIAGVGDIAGAPFGLSPTRGFEGVGVDFAETQKILDEMYSPAQKAAQARVEGADGFLGTAGALVQNPSVVAQEVGQSLGQMIGGAGIARGILGTGSKILAPMAAGALGEGVLGGGGAAADIQAQTGTALTGSQASAAVGSGAGTALLGFLGGKVAQQLGINDIDTVLASGKFQETQKGFLRRMTEGGLSEGAFEELPQSAQEQMWQNYATDKPIMQGVAEASAHGLLAGAAMGAVAGVPGGSAQNTNDIPGTKPPITEAPPPPKPGSTEPLIFTDTEAEMQDIEHFITETDATLAAKEAVVEAVGPVGVTANQMGPAEQEEYNAYLDATAAPREEPSPAGVTPPPTNLLVEGLEEQRPDFMMTPEVRNNPDNFNDPNTWVPRQERRVTKVVGEHLPPVPLGTTLGQMPAEFFENADGPVVVQVGEDSDQRPQWYNNLLLQEIYEMAKTYNPKGKYVLLPEDAGIAGTEDGALGYSFKQNGIWYIVPRHMTNANEQGSHVSKEGQGAYNANARLQAGSTLWHEFGHSILEDFLLAGAAGPQEQLLRAGLESGVIPEELLQGLAPEAVALIRRWAQLRADLASGKLSGHEAAARFMSPAKLANKTLMGQVLGGTEKRMGRSKGRTVAGRPFEPYRVARALRRGGNDNFWEFAAEQMAKYQMEEGRMEASPFVEGLFPEGFGFAGFETALKEFFKPMLRVLQQLFDSLKARGFVRAEAEFSQWLESLATGKPMEKPVKGRRKKTAAKATKPKKSEVATPEQVEAEIDWESKSVQDTLKAALVSTVKSKMLERTSETYQALLQLLNDGMYPEFLDQIEPFLEKKLKFDMIGAKARLSPLQKTGLNRAFIMQSEGKSAEEIRAWTGWVLWPDGHWRYEISSDKARIKAMPRKEWETLFLSEVLDHRELFKRYPQLAKIRVIGDPDAKHGRASFHEGTGTLMHYVMPAGESIESALPLILHEVQHAIQAIEGFARGGNAGMFRRPDIKTLMQEAKNTLQTFARSPLGKVAFSELVKEVQAYTGNEIAEDLVTVRNRLLENFHKNSESVAVKMKNGEYTDLYYFDIDWLLDNNTQMPEKLVQDLKAILRVRQTLMEMVKEYDTANDKYYRLLGEIEAYATQARAAWTPEMRRRTPVSIPQDFIISYNIAAENLTWASGTAVAAGDGTPLTVMRSKTMDFPVDGQRVQVYSPNLVDATWIASLADKTAEGAPLFPFMVRMLNPLRYDAAGQAFTPGMLQGLVRKARTARNDGVVVKNAVGYQSPVFVSLSVENSRMVPQQPPASSQLRFDRTSLEGDQMGRMWDLVKEKLHITQIGESLAKVWQAQAWVLQLQQIAHIHPDWAPLKVWEETRVKYYRKAANMHSAADAAVRQMHTLGKEQLKQMYKLTLAEYRGQKHWTNMTPGDKPGHWIHEPTAELLAQMRKVGIDVDSASGKQMLQIYLDAKNALQFQQDEMLRVMMVLTKHKYAANPGKQAEALRALVGEFRVLRDTPFWPQQTFGKKVIQVFETDDQGRKMLVFESGSDSNEELAEIEKAARKKFPNGLLVRKDRTMEDSILMRLPVEYVDDVAVALGLDRQNKEDAAKIEELRDLMQSLYAKTPANTYSPAKAVVQGQSQDFIRNFADFSLRNSNFIAKMEYRKYFDKAMTAMATEVEALAFSRERDMKESARKLMKDTVEYMMNPNEEVQQIRSFVAITYLWANMKTAVLNLWGLVHTWLFLNRELGYLAGTGAFAKGVGGAGKTLGHEGGTAIANIMKGGAKAAFTSITDPNWEMVDGKPTELRLALEQAKQENVLDQSYAYYLAGQANRGDIMRAWSNLPGGAVAQKGMKMVVDTGMAPFRVFELGVRRGTFISIYSALQKTRPQLTTEQRYEETVRMVGLLQGDYTKGNRPRIMRGNMLTLMTIFMTYVHNAAWGGYGGVEMGLKRQESLEGRASPKMYRSYTMQFMLLYLVAAGLEGLPFAENMLDIFDWLYKQISGSGKGARQALQEMIYEQTGDPVMVMRATRGLTFNLGGVDASRSVGLGRILPGTDAITDSARSTDEYLGGVLSAMSGIGGGYVSWAISTGMAMDKVKAGMPLMTVLEQQAAKLPGGIGSMMKAREWAEIDARGPAGGLIAKDPETGKPREVTQQEINLKALGFQASSISLGQQAKAEHNETTVYWGERRKQLMSNLYHAQYVMGDREATADVKAAIADFNKNAPHPNLKISAGTIKRSMDARKRAAEAAEKLVPQHKYLRGIVKETLEPMGVGQEE